MQIIALIITIVIVGGSCAAFMYFVGGVGHFRLDTLERVAADINAHGFHFFGTYRPATGSESGGGAYTQIWHVFVRSSDGQKFRTLIAERATAFAAMSSGKVDGFQSFDEDIWKKQGYLVTTSILSGMVNSPLAVDANNSIGVSLEENSPPITFTMGKYLLKISRIIDSAGYHVDCAGQATWKISV